MTRSRSAAAAPPSRDPAPEAVSGSYVKVTMNFRDDSLRKLDDLQRLFAAAVNRTAAVAIAIDLAAFWSRALREGQKLMLRAKNGSLREILIPGVTN